MPILWSRRNSPAALASFISHLILIVRYTVFFKQRHSVTEFRSNSLMKDWGVTIGARIKSRREELKMPVAQLARAAGLATSTIYDLMRSDSVSSTKLHLIAKALGLNVYWLETNRGPRLASETGSVINEPLPDYFPPISPKEAEIGHEWGKLKEPQRSVVASQIRLLVAAQKREESRRKRGNSGG